MIEIITTGGTIDKTYNPLNGELEFTHSYIPSILEDANLTIDYQFNHLLQKDSLEMEDSDRDLIYKTCNSIQNDKILITHGTDTMVQTAQMLAQITDKTIILTGAMIPYSIKNSDAIFNLGFAISSLYNLKNGVYIAMNGRIFNYDNVMKNTKLGVFEWS